MKWFSKQIQYKQVLANIHCKHLGDKQHYKRKKSWRQSPLKHQHKQEGHLHQTARVPHQRCLHLIIKQLIRTAFIFVPTQTQRGKERCYVHFKLITSRWKQKQLRQHYKELLNESGKEQTAALQQKHLKAPRQKRQRSGPLMIYAAHGWTYTNNKPVLHSYEV